jgi:hypothetical protein
VPDEQRAQSMRDRILGWHRLPLRVAGVAVVAWILMWDTGRSVFATDQGTHPWLDGIVLASIAYSAIAQLLLLPRLLVPRALRAATRPDRVPLTVASMRLAFASTPFMVGFALVGAGANQWVSTVALLASTLLLIPYVRQTRV